MTATLLHPQLKCPCHLSLPIGILYQAHCLMSTLQNVMADSPAVWAQAHREVKHKVSPC